ncbi:MAG: AtpZ/AtpI family protein [Campylobacterota bacterium]|nr:AtpZ/AtpI family protein [Campylobacterota bacterium]
MEENKENQEEVPKHRDKIEALDHLSLGISIAVAIALGVGLGLLLKSWTGYTWTLWLGVFYGVAAAFLNVKKAYTKAKKELDKLADDPKYAHLKEHGFSDKDDK